MTPPVLVAVGTRPEAIKLAPVILALRAAAIPTRVVATGQHGALATDALFSFGLAPDRRFDAMPGGGDLAGLAARLLTGMADAIAAERPALVVVHGDTATTFAAALAATYARVPVAHVEAGLRTHDPAQPWPEELHRRAVAQLAALHFAPTPLARANLIAEGIAPDAVEVTGNTVVDALRLITAALDWRALDTQAHARWPELVGRRLILVTAHRRETIGAPLAALCDALTRLAALPNVALLYPIHPNPAVAGPVRVALGSTTGMTLADPLDYPLFLSLIRRAALVITDSGGVQEEAPAFGTPVLVARARTERPEAIDAGFATLTGTDPDAIVRKASRLLAAPRPTAANPFGDGHAAPRIAARIARELAASREEQVDERP